MVTILKIGGKLLSDPAELKRSLDYFAQLPSPKLLVHGGGNKASEVMQQIGIKPVMVDGRRITDDRSLEVVTMVYAGLINTRLVAGLQARSVSAIGISGADGNLILAEKRPVTTIDYGFAGDIVAINAEFLQYLFSAGHCPVVCPITHDGQGQLLNTNADTIASALALALAAAGSVVSLRYLFELPGVLRELENPDSVIPLINGLSYIELLETGIIYGGMRPKLDNAFAAIRQGVSEVVIGNPDSLAADKGTKIVA